jgi:PAS domain S-box-containing protein
MPDVTPFSNSPIATAAAFDSAHRTLPGSILDAIGEGILLADLHGHVLFANTAIKERFGLPAASIEGNSYETIWGAEVAAKIREVDAAVLSTGQPQVILREIDGPTGKQVVESRKFPTFGPDGAATGVVSIVTDVTATRLIEASKRKSETMLADAERLAAMGSYEVDVLTGQVAWSDGMFFLLDLDPQTVVPTLKLFYAMVHERDLAYLISAMPVMTEGPVLGEFSMVSATGREFLVASKSHCFVDSEGRPVRIVGNLRDITEARRAALELQASEARFRSVVSSAACGIVVTNMAGTIVFWNQAATDIYGYSEAEAVGMSFYKLIPARLHAQRNDARRLAAETQTEVRIPEFAQVGLRKGGEEFPTDVSLTSYEVGGERYFTAMLKDISERRALELLKESFLAVVSHELRTPLNTTVCALDLLSSGSIGEVPARGKRMLEIATSNTSRLVRIVEDILDMHRLGHDALPLSIRDIDLVGVLHEAVETVVPQAKVRGVRINLGLELPEGYTIPADAGRLHQVVVNLLTNAVRYNPVDTPVTVQATATADGVELRVIDHGPGVPEEHRTLVFERFFQGAGPAGGQSPGTGLGLAISQGLVTQQGGHIWVEPTPGGGATFVVRLGGIL